MGEDVWTYVEAHDFYMNWVDYYIAVKYKKFDYDNIH